ncbi:Dehydrocurvularin biosynthesis regulator [Paramyrothecium foliicola]|nr:Dehydrocurvularin biosynthesis regulator [Paramyrothecium foliicola]
MSADESIEALTAAPLPKRRKLRKGTQSCWECKRRKIRCTFTISAGSVCDGCRSRQTNCVSQEFPDVARLNKKVIGSGEAESPHSSSDVTVNAWNGNGLGIQTPSPGSDEFNKTIHALPTEGIVNQNHLNSLVHASDNLRPLSDVLIATWPSDHDLDVILSVPIDLAVLFHGIVCLPYAQFYSAHITSPREILVPPTKGSHPILIARKLLLLGALLQGVPLSAGEKLACMHVEYRVLMSRVVDIASKHVTSNDDLMSSVEGIECAMIESMYQNNLGKLCRAWVINRKAMVMAQMLGLHKSKKLPRMIARAETSRRIDPNFMWFRLVCSDRYLSLLLDFPQGSIENPFGTRGALGNCVALERLERLQAIASGLILQRNNAQRIDVAETQKIDTILHDAAALMPPKWWLGSFDLNAKGNKVEAFKDSVRLVTQFAHRHLLVQLHLPYLLQPSSDNPSYDYSKMTAANASREIIDLFVSFRSTDSSAYYCRGIDFVAFVACTTLCLAHIESRRQHGASSNGTISAFHSLQHQRLADRGLLERTLEIVDNMSKSNQDVIAEKMSAIISPLLAIENSSANGGKYHTSTSFDIEGQGMDSTGTPVDMCGVLRIKIPHFGTVKIEQTPQPAANSHLFDGGIGIIHEPPSPIFDRVNVTNLQNPDSLATEADGIAASLSQSTCTDLSANSTYFTQAVEPNETESANTGPNILPPELFSSDMGLGVDDWVLQGVDAALFTNLMFGHPDSAA